MRIGLSEAIKIVENDKNKPVKIGVKLPQKTAKSIKMIPESTIKEVLPPKTTLLLVKYTGQWILREKIHENGFKA